MNQLSLHPHCASGSAIAIAAAIEPTPGGCRAVYVARGDISRISVPKIDQPGRFDNLWKTTCFEIFWSHDGTSYREFNLSPSTHWASYDFDGFRENMRDAPAGVEIDVNVSDTELRLEAKIICDLLLPATVALNAIIEGSDGVNQYWAMAFGPGAPDFHDVACRTLRLEASA